MTAKNKSKSRPIVGSVPKAGKPINPGTAPATRQWTFSFRYFRQIDHFGAGGKDAPWFISLLEKISDLCTIDVDDLLANPKDKLHWRLHEIDWNHKNIPLKRSDLNWIDQRYLNNEIEFPFWQFSVSKALGRVIGFWDERGIFNLVLVDPSHNMQPSLFSDYKLRDAPIGGGEFEVAIAKVEELILKCDAHCRCRSLYGEIQSALTYRLEFSAMLVSMPAELFDNVVRLIGSGSVNSVSELLSMAVAELPASSIETA